MLRYFKQPKTPLLATLFIAGVLLVVPQVAFAGIDATIWAIFTGIGGFFTWIGGLALDYSISMLVIGMGDLLLGSIGVAVNDLWVVIRDICNILFIFGLIYIGLRTILKTNDSSTQKQLGLLIVAALLINFSLLVTKTVIDFSNILAVEIHQLVEAEGGFGSTYFGVPVTGIPGAFMDEMQLETFFEQETVTATFSTSEEIATTAQIFVFGLMAMIFMMVAGVVFLAGALIIIKRFIVLILFMIFSPLMFAGFILPAFSSLQSYWWQNFLKNAFLAPAYIFMLYLSLSVTKNINSGSFAELYASGSTSSSSFSLIIYFLVVAGFLFGSLMVAQKMGSATASASITGLKSAGTKLRGSAQSWAGRKSIGRIGESLLKRQERKGGGSRVMKNIYSGAANKKFGGSYSRADDTKYKKDRAQLAANADTTEKTDRAIAGITSSNPTNDQRIAFSDTISNLSTTQLTEQLKKHKPGSAKYQAIVGAMSADQISKVMDSKPEDFNDAQKASLGDARQAAVRTNLKNPAGATSPTTLDVGIRKASIEDLAALDLKDDLQTNAGQLQASQIEKMKDNKHFQGPRHTILKQAYEDKIESMGNPDIINSRTNDENIAKLPAKVLNRAGFYAELKNGPTDKLSNSLLAQIANRTDLDGSVKQNIGQHVLTAYGASSVTDAALPARLQNFFNNGPGTQMTP